MTMERLCNACGRPYQAKRSTSRFCGSSCRVAASRAGGGKGAERSTERVVAGPGVSPPVPGPAVTGGAAEAVRVELEAAGRLGSFAGQTALVLAGRLDGAHESVDSGSSLAAVARELRVVMAEALADVSLVVDPVDELRRRREAKRVG